MLPCPGPAVLWQGWGSTRADFVWIANTDGVTWKQGSYQALTTETCFQPWGGHVLFCSYHTKRQKYATWNEP